MKDNMFVIKGDSKDIREQAAVIIQDSFRTGHIVTKQPNYINDKPRLFWELQDAHFMIEFPKKHVNTVNMLSKRIRRLAAQSKFYYELSHRLHINFDNRLRAYDSEKNRLLHLYYDCLLDHVNDHKDAYLEIGNQKVIPQQVSFRDDIQTYMGIALNNRNITGEGFTKWSHVAVGTGTEEPFVWSDSLQTEIEFTDFSHGFFTASGTAILYAGMFGESLVDNLFQEGLVRNQESQSGAKVLCKQTFTNDPIDHDENDAGFSVAGVLEYAPIIDGAVFQ